jgi:hypothetical protein
LFLQEIALEVYLDKVFKEVTAEQLENFKVEEEGDCLQKSEKLKTCS